MRTMGNMKKSITADSDFAAWAAARSQKTNRSLAGARLAIPEPQKHAEIKSQAQQWGMTVEDATMTDGHSEVRAERGESSFYRMAALTQPAA